jgi:membrane-associated phospholipid phosphatase
MKGIKDIDGMVSNKERKTHRSGVTDKILKWAPLFTICLLDAAGVKTKNSFRQHVFLIGTGKILVDAMVYPLKNTVHRQRPDHSPRRRSFPSSHTATSFLGAALLHQELKDTQQTLSYSGYFIATATGILRMYKNRHWLSDVIAGAAIGVVCGNLACWIMNKAKDKTSARHRSEKSDINPLADVMPNMYEGNRSF